MAPQNWGSSAQNQSVAIGTQYMLVRLECDLILMCSDAFSEMKMDNVSPLSYIRSNASKPPDIDTLWHAGSLFKDAFELGIRNGISPWRSTESEFSLSKWNAKGFPFLQPMRWLFKCCGVSYGDLKLVCINVPLLYWNFNIFPFPRLIFTPLIDATFRSQFMLQSNA